MENEGVATVETQNFASVHIRTITGQKFKTVLSA